MWLKSKIAKISALKVKRIAKSLKFDPVNNSSLKVCSALYYCLLIARSPTWSDRVLALTVEGVLV